MSNNDMGCLSPSNLFEPIVGFNVISEVKDFTEWNFNSSSDSDINWKDIKKSLTYAEPLAIVTRTYRDYMGVDKYVVVNKQLMDKALSIGLGGVDVPIITAVVEKRVFCTEENFSVWVDWAKAVKKAKWPDTLKSTINVILPKV